jgi:hypothetical protein
MWATVVHGRAIRKAFAASARWLIVALLNFWQKLPDGALCAGEWKPLPKKRMLAALVFDILFLICINVKDYSLRIFMNIYEYLWIVLSKQVILEEKS